MSNSINTRGPQFDSSNGRDLANWAWATRLPWLVSELGLVAGVICGSISEAIRCGVYGLPTDSELPKAIDWKRNNIVVSPPGTGKGMAIFVEALKWYKNVIVLVPSVIQAHKLEASIDELYVHELGGCLTSQRKSGGPIQIVTTGIFAMMVMDRGSVLWQDDTVIIVDEAQRVLSEDPLTEFYLGHIAARGVMVNIVSATIDPSNLASVFGHGDHELAVIHELSKQMHPIDIKVIACEWEQFVKANAAEMKDGETRLYFVGSRRGCEKTRKIILALELSHKVVSVTGGHMTEEQLISIHRLQQGGHKVIVVATPGTMDSSVTINGLSFVGIHDEKFVVDFNEHGVQERTRCSIEINNMWQMVRRVGRQARADGKKDKVVIVSNYSRKDVMAEKPKFDKLTGSSPWTPIEELLLKAAILDVPFTHVQDYMLTKYSSEHVEAAIRNLFDHGMIERTECQNDNDGFILTEKGKTCASMPYSYKWNRMILEAPDELKVPLCMAAASQQMEQVKDFEEEFGVDSHETSEVIRKINLGFRYCSMVHDDAQRQVAQQQGLSFRRMEQVETLFDLGLRALDLKVASAKLRPVSQELSTKLQSHLVTEGLRVGLFELYLLDNQAKRGWHEMRDGSGTESGVARDFMTDRGCALKLEQNAKGGICAVVAEAVWFVSNNGHPCANLDNVTIVPAELVEELVKHRAAEEGWFKLTFEESEDHRGRPELRASKDGADFVPSKFDVQPEVGRSYWCSVSRHLGYGLSAVWIHYPVRQISVEEAKEKAERVPVGQPQYSSEKDVVEQLIELRYEGEKVGEEVQVVKGEQAKQVFRAWVIRQIEYGNSVANFPQFLNCHNQLAKLRELTQSPRGRGLIEVPTTEAIRIRVYDALDTACSVKEIVIPELFDFSDWVTEAQHRVDELRPETVQVAGSDYIVDYSGYYGTEVTVQEWTKAPREGVKLPDGKALKVKFVVAGVTYGPGDNVANLQDQAAEREVQRMVQAFQPPVLEIPNSDALRKSFPEMESREIGTHPLTGHSVVMLGILAIDPDGHPAPYEWRWMLHEGEAKRLRKEAVNHAAKLQLKGGGASGGVGLFGNPADFK